MSVRQRRPVSVTRMLAATLAPGCLPAFTSDGLNVQCRAIAHFYSLITHFGE